MTPAERADVKVLNASRRQRIATGSGTQVSDVNQLTTRFLEARKMMSQMAKGGGIPGMPGMPGLPGGGAGFGGGKKGQAKKGKKGKGKKAGRVSGNPAKRAQQQSGQPAAADADQSGQADQSAGPAGAPPSTLGELPDAFTDLLGR